MSFAIFEQHESDVRTYCRSFPAIFDTACGPFVFDTEGHRYIDFLAGAGSLNYGHNNPVIGAAVIEHLRSGRICQSLDLHTSAKAEFIARFVEFILRPRGLGDFKVQFVGPTGTNAVEAALKLARKATGRTEIVAFTSGFHGVSLGALAASGESRKRQAGGVPLGHVMRAPFDGYFGAGVDTIAQLETLFADPNSGCAPPAAFIVETVQGEGGLNVASSGWLRRLARLSRRLGAKLIIDEVQTGCGRTGDFFGFEESGVIPDLICVSKSISGFGLPMALVLIAPGLDVWAPGEHNGTFRGSNLSFAAATAAILAYWRDDALLAEVRLKAGAMRRRLRELEWTHAGVRPVGRGLMAGLRFDDAKDANRVSMQCFEHRLIVETCGPEGNTLKLLPPLTTPLAVLEEGLDIMARCIRAVVGERVALPGAA